jgi:hypothetical protein
MNKEYAASRDIDEIVESLIETYDQAKHEVMKIHSKQFNNKVRN